MSGGFKLAWASARYRIGSTGLGGLGREAALALWRRAVDDDEHVFELPLGRAPRPAVPSMPVECYARAADLPAERLAELRGRIRRPGMPEALVERHLGGLLHLFEDGARLWLPLRAGQVVGVVWTLEGPAWPSAHFPVFPLGRGDVLLFAGWIFREFRRQGLYPGFLSCVLEALEREGAQRVCAAVKVWNAPALRTMARVGFGRIGRCRTIRLGRRSVVVWRAPSPEGPSDAVR